MKYFTTSILILTAALATVPLSRAYAGGQAGGGGGVIQCVDPRFQPLFIPITRVINGKMVVVYEMQKPPLTLPDGRTYELLDLWEPETGNGPFYAHKLTVPADNSTPVDLQIQRAMEKLEKNLPQFAPLAWKYLRAIQKMQPIQRGYYVLPPEDTHVRYLPLGCQIKGLGYFVDSNKEQGTVDHLIYDPSTYDSLLLVDRAAFFMHEAIYKVFRMHYSETNSWHTRRLVGLLFSTQETFTWSEVINGYPSAQSNN